MELVGISYFNLIIILVVNTYGKTTFGKPNH